MGLLPSVSCICPTFGRTRLLVESIESFLRQDYKGLTELIICNDCPEQKLFISPLYRNIKIINLPVRCANLGQKRNEATKPSSHSLIMTWGDDDIHLPWRIADCVKAWSLGGQYIREGRFFYAEGEKISLLKRPPTGPFLMAAGDYWRLGGIPDVNCGEDRDFLTLVKKDNLIISTTESPFPAFIYRWGTGHYHISGLGDDKPGKVTGWDRVGAHVSANIKKGIEPVGNIELIPVWKKDYIPWAQAALPVEAN